MNTVHRFSYVLCMLSLSLCSLAMPFFNAEAKQDKPNVILILADDLGWSDLGSYGSEIRTPTLDTLAKSGVRFTQFSNTSKCFPTRAALLTGQYAQTVGAGNTWRNPWVNDVTLADVMKQAGYHTYMVGKHHGVDHPMDLGFDHYWGLLAGAANFFNPGHKRPTENEPAQKRKLERTYCFDKKCLTPFTPEKNFYATDDFSTWSIDFIEKSLLDDAPFFLYLSYTAPHDPLHIPKEDRHLYSGVYDKGYTNIRQARITRMINEGLIPPDAPISVPTYTSWFALSEQEKANEIAKKEVYAAMIERMDRQISRLVSLLKQQDIFDNTLIMFLSDNGSSAEVVDIGKGRIGDMDRWSSLGRNWANVGNTPFRRAKNSSYGGGVNTPFIAHWPSGITIGENSNGRIVHYPSHVIDILPTLLELTAVSYPEKLRGENVPKPAGESLLHILADAKLDSQMNRESPLFYQWQNERAVRKDEWRLVGERVDKTSSWQYSLFNINSDITETSNLAKQYPEIVTQLTSALDAWEKSTRLQYKQATIDEQPVE